LDEVSQASRREPDLPRLAARVDVRHVIADHDGLRGRRVERWR
jgi:hypothetical protein